MHLVKPILWNWLSRIHPARIPRGGGSLSTNLVLKLTFGSNLRGTFRSAINRQLLCLRTRSSRELLHKFNSLLELRGNGDTYGRCETSFYLTTEVYRFLLRRRSTNWFSSSSSFSFLFRLFEVHSADSWSSIEMVWFHLAVIRGDTLTPVWPWLDGDIIAT